MWPLSSIHRRGARDIDEKWWNLIVKICEEQGFTHGILHITNLDV